MGPDACTSDILPDNVPLILGGVIFFEKRASSSTALYAENLKLYRILMEVAAKVPRRTSASKVQ
jgi:hypothetical protein